MPPPTLPPPRDAGVPGSPPPPGRPATAAAPAARPLQSEGRKARVTVETGDPGRCGRAPAAGRGPGQSWKTVSRRRSDRGRVPRGTAALSELRADLRCRRGSAGARATPASNRTCAPQGGGRGRGRGRPGAGLGVRRLGFWSWPCAPLSGDPGDELPVTPLPCLLRLVGGRNQARILEEAEKNPGESERGKNKTKKEKSGCLCRTSTLRPEQHLERSAMALSALQEGSSIRVK
ncbi:WAS/WASL-interacting protein family member 3-like isoform X2 [Mustela erminea]|uniref:WAS/WASL-interacting protein family member 3-like isoform X2 n=1 Tax=Mustela erminea TaxID=36723 RepID=UPI001386DA6B|nr:WAS/WASL-interacting protein family member 3-like isoform X2 [Mustela erminea]